MNLCNSCTNIKCEFQSGIVRKECTFYMPPHIEPDNCGNYDVISRQAVLELIADYDLSMGQVVKGIHALPSVTLQENTGHWINKDVRKEEYVLSGKCSVCGQVRVIDEFCSHCGAKMVEVQE